MKHPGSRGGTRWGRFAGPGPAEDGSRFPWSFTGRQDEVARLLAEGLCNRGIGSALGISKRTVKNHPHAVFAKLDVGDRTQAVIKLMRYA